LGYPRQLSHQLLMKQKISLKTKTAYEGCFCLALSPRLERGTLCSASKCSIH
jgi:hypothetical protein